MRHFFDFFSIVGTRLYRAVKYTRKTGPLAKLVGTYEVDFFIAQICAERTTTATQAQSLVRCRRSVGLGKAWVRQEASGETGSDSLLAVCRTVIPGETGVEAGIPVQATQESLLCVSCPGVLAVCKLGNFMRRP
jgi:hypothetical protein